MIHARPLRLRLNISLSRGLFLNPDHWKIGPQDVNIFAVSYDDYEDADL